MGFPDTNGYGWDNSDVKPIYHAMLSITDKKNSPPETDDTTNANLPIGAKIFTLKQVRTSKSASKYNIAEMAGYLVEHPEFPVNPRDVSPYDISVGYQGKGEQGWVIIELDPDINWRFSPGDYGISEKEAELGPGANFYLRHLSKAGGSWEDSKRVKTDDCRILFFGVAHRGGRNTPNPKDKGSCFVNLHVEFYQDEFKSGPNEGKASKTLKIIIDPDVKNDGPDEFP
jgi:hypothetical protein